MLKSSDKYLIYIERELILQLSSYISNYFIRYQNIVILYYCKVAKFCFCYLIKLYLEIVNNIVNFKLDQ